MKAKHEPFNFPRVFVWKFINFSEILRQAKTGEQILKIETTSFCTERYGYILKIAMYPNGYGDCMNTHLTVFIVVMKGEYDAILSWPFEQKVKFTLIDQQEDPVERKNITHLFYSGQRPRSLRKTFDRRQQRALWFSFIFRKTSFKALPCE